MSVVNSCCDTDIILKRTEPLLTTNAFIRGHCIESKIETLFTDRRISENLKLIGLSQLDHQWLLNKLQRLQRWIYALDCYGESTWEIQSHVLERIWYHIYESLRLFDCELEEVEKLVSDIKAYQQIEMQMREGKLPTQIPIQDFYHLKTCDVRLSRILIAKITGDRLAFSLAPMWSCYDLASEVCDDLSDILEDSRNFNCNRLLIQLGLFETSVTWAEYTDFLEKIRRRTCRLLKQSEVSGFLEGSKVCRWALQRVAEAKVILGYLCNARPPKSPSQVIEKIKEGITRSKTDIVVGRFD